MSSLCQATFQRKPWALEGTMENQIEVSGKREGEGEERPKKKEDVEKDLEEDNAKTVESKQEGSGWR